MGKPRIAINGFGRIGRLTARILLDGAHDVDVVAVNDVTPPATLAHLFRHDSVHGPYQGKVVAHDDTLQIGDAHIRIFSCHKPSNLPWPQVQPDVVVECTGRFTQHHTIDGHLEAGAPRVLISAPSEDAQATIVRGVNDHVLGDQQIVSAASCTTNALAPVLKVLHDTYGVHSGLMNTIHAITGDQLLVDGAHSDLRRSRASMLSMIPTSTGAARAIGHVLPELAGKLDGLAVRVPTQDVSLLDLTCKLETACDVEGLLAALQAAADGSMAGILGVEREPLVSVDFTHDPRSSIVDAPSLMVKEDLVKLLSWYDNEWGYANRIAELAIEMAR